MSGSEDAGRQNQVGLVGNPFCTSRIRPGSIPFLFSAADDETDVGKLSALIDRWRAAGCLGQIVGPHGSGKTTLSYAVAGAVVADPSFEIDVAQSIVFRPGSFSGQGHGSVGGEGAGHEISWLRGTLGELGASLQVTSQTIAGSRADAVGSQTMVVIDGLEQLTPIARWTLLRSLQRRQLPTLITTHRPLRSLPLVGPRVALLQNLETDLALFAKLVSGLAGQTVAATDPAIEACFVSAKGNCRDALLKLYDWHADSAGTA